MKINDVMSSPLSHNKTERLQNYQIRSKLVSNETIKCANSLASGSEYAIMRYGCIQNGGYECLAFLLVSLNSLLNFTGF